MMYYMCVCICISGHFCQYIQVRIIYIYNFLFYIFINIYTYFLWIYVCMYVQVLVEGIRIPGTEVTGDCEPLDMGSGTKPVSVCKIPQKTSIYNCN